MTESGLDELLGTGWAFPVVADPALAREEESVRQAVWVILSTAPGERVMRPDFGCGIHDFVFSVDDATTASLIAEMVRLALLTWEPRIDVADVRVERSGGDQALLISITYEVISASDTFDLTYPFYLNGGGG